MLKKSATTLLICAALLLATAPSKALAQTPAGRRQSADGAPAGPGSDLRAALAEVAAKGRADTATGADIRRMEREWLNPQAKEKGQSGYTRNQKILVISIVAGLVILAVVLAANTEKGGHTFCDIDPADPDCIGTR